jgi:hypothetical protein
VGFVRPGGEAVDEEIEQQLEAGAALREERAGT